MAARKEYMLALSVLNEKIEYSYVRASASAPVFEYVTSAMGFLPRVLLMTAPFSIPASKKSNKG